MTQRKLTIGLSARTLCYLHHLLNHSWNFCKYCLVIVRSCFWGLNNNNLTKKRVELTQSKNTTNRKRNICMNWHCLGVTDGFELIGHSERCGCKTHPPAWVTRWWRSLCHFPISRGDSSILHPEARQAAQRHPAVMLFIWPFTRQEETGRWSPGVFAEIT